MQSEIRYAPAFSMAEITLAQGESLVVESGSMVGMSDNMRITTSVGGTNRGFFGKILAFLAALIRRVFGGESIFMNTYTPEGGSGKVLIAPALAGDIVYKKIEGASLYIQATSYLASSPELSIRTKWMGLKSLFGGEGLFLLRTEGSGQLWLNSYGAIKEIEVNGEYTVDSGHIVAFEDSLDFRVATVGGLKSTLMSGEGLVTRFSGKGRLWIQSHNLSSLVSWVIPMLPN